VVELLGLVRRWIAGEGIDEAIARAKEESRRGRKTIVNILGEHLEEKAEVEKVKDEYLELIDALAEAGINGAISVKPSQLGTGIDADYCLANLENIAEKAREKGIFLWLDMESSAYTQRTINHYLKLLGEYREVGVALQAYLKRSERDLRELLKAGAKVRLVKGAYKEPPRIRYASNADIKENFKGLMALLFKGGAVFAIATHDKELIDEAKKLSAGRKGIFEFQMLMGIGEGLKEELMKDGYTVAEYIPYGKNWLPYTLRRLRDRKENVLLLLKSVIRGS
jgi:proline dehydrogenase